MAQDSLATTTLTNLLVVELRQTVADAMHHARSGFVPSSEVLTDAIADITFNLSVQGASFIEVLIIDPFWQLLRDYGNGSFIDVDADGYLIEIEFEFPKDSGREWYLVAANPTSDLTQGNLKLTFEDKQIYILRNLDQFDGPSKSFVDETRLQFIRRLLKAAKLTSKEIFSADTKKFEASPPGFTPQQVANWDKQWTAQQQAKQREAKMVQAAVQQATQAVTQGTQAVTAPIDNLFNPPSGTDPTGSRRQNNWWAQNLPTAHLDGIPNAGYVPGVEN